MSLNLIKRLAKGAKLTATEHDANLTALEKAAFPDSVLVVRSLEDLPDPVGDEVILPANKTVLFFGDLDLGTDALRLSAGTLPRGLAGASVMSANPNGVIRATNLGEAVVMRELNVIALAGPCLDLTGGLEHQLNLFFMGLIGVAPGTSVGTITGFDVAALKDCYINAADGIRFAGSPNKVFVDRCPFYGIADGAAAVTFDAGLNARRVDMTQNFFKHADTGIPIRAEAGYSVGYGRVSGSMREGPDQMLDGLASSDANWWFTGNDGIADSRIAAQAYLTEPATTPITTAGSFVQVEGAFDVAEMTQRMELNANNELVNIGNQPILITFIATLTVNPSNNDRLAFRVTRDGETMSASEVFVEQGAGPGSSPRPGSVSSLVYLGPGQGVGLAVANMASTADVPWLSCTYVVS